jgi:sterol desaturase/sphingolipid hydroxylase (fatty acid hydroxylase superfamily)
MQTRLSFMKPKLSFSAHTRKWLLDNFAIGIKNYWFTYFADSSSALFFLFWEMHARHTRPLGVGLTVAAGYASWTLTEYVFHRWIYHQEQGIYGDGHRMHHEDPVTPLAMPWFMTTISVFALWYLCAIALHIPFFSGILAGWLSGFVWYSLVHHSHHHWNIPGSWMRKLKAYHRIHHQIPQTNFGVTMRFWDDIFGTRHRKSSRNSAFASDDSDESETPESEHPAPHALAAMSSDS